MIKVLIVDDQQLFRDLLEHMLTNSTETTVAAKASNGHEALEQAQVCQPDVILMDLEMPDGSGLEATRKIKQGNPAAKVLVLTASHVQADVAEAIRSGADGYILKSVSKDELILAIKSVYNGMEVIHRDVRDFARNIPQVSASNDNSKTVQIDGYPIVLSGRDLAIIRMLVEGKTTAEMAKSLFLAEGRVRNILTEIIARLMLKDRTQLAVFAIQNGLLS